ncbi:MAG: hypothetical protein HS111_04160 [Kofleriaceae bacterium]|nr:hypothetical protein [Kofleriaceae bacterium]MCL4224533.1 hypothetical protein [Myxococcales bacterium]
MNRKSSGDDRVTSSLPGNARSPRRAGGDASLDTGMRVHGCMDVVVAAGLARAARLRVGSPGSW